jgi:serine protease Do
MRGQRGAVWPRVALYTALSIGFGGMGLGVVACSRQGAMSGGTVSASPGSVSDNSPVSLAEGSPASGGVGMSGSAGAPGNAEPGSFAPIAKAVTPAVVSIETVLPPDTTEEDDQDQGGIPPGLLPPGFRNPGRGGPGGGNGQGPAPRRALGSGFIVTSDGYLLTNNHVVSGATRVTVGLSDRRIFPGHVIGHDPSTEVALVKIDATGLPTLPLGNDSSVQVGDWVLAVGNPLGLNFTVTSGIISAKGRGGSLGGLFASRYAIVDFLQTDAVINPGNSGGPLIDMHGRVIGINTAIASPTGVYAGYGFAVPISIATIVMNELRATGHVNHPILGVQVLDVGPADAAAAGLHEIRGVLVENLTGSSSPAAKAGLEAGDVIVAVDHHAIDRVADMQRLIFGYKPGQTIPIDVMRFGAKKTYEVTLGEPPATAQLASSGGGDESGGGVASRRLGVNVMPLTPAMASQTGAPQGLVVTHVDASGPAFGVLFQNDVIEAALTAEGRKPMRTVDDLQQVVSHPLNGAVSFIVASPGQGGGAPQTRVANILLSQGGAS